MPSAPSATLVARSIVKLRNGVVVLDGVSCTLHTGSRLGVVGPNGVGKSTLLQILAGIEAPDRGAVERRPPSATVGYLAQQPERRAGETVRAALARRTGVAAASAGLDDAARALADGAPGGDDRYADALDRYLALGAADFDARADEVVADLGLPARLLDTPTTVLSGGEAARVALAAILLARFDVLLLDEPTNDLDFAALERLESFVLGWRGPLAVVSHDRAFLERTITDVLELDAHQRTAAEYHGGWHAYLDERATARRHAEEAYEQYAEQRDTLVGRARRERQWAVQGVAKVKRSNEPDKHIRHFKTATSEQLAARARRTEQQLARLDAVEKPWEGWELRFDIGAAPRGSARVVALDDVVVTRGAFTLGPVSIEVRAGERVAVTGANGSGKSTLIAVVLGTVAPAAGRATLGPGVHVGTLDQARVAFLDAPTLVDGVVRATGLVLSEARSLLAKFGLDARDVTRAPATLSPGERTRAELALLMAGGVNCVVLDEPTNHLDLEAIEQLEQALGRYRGTLVVVSHDRAFLDALSLSRTIELHDGRVTADIAL